MTQLRNPQARNRGRGATSAVGVTISICHVMQIANKFELSDENGRMWPRCSLFMFCHEIFTLRKESLEGGGGGGLQEKNV
jgi:hypothetical protein